MRGCIMLTYKKLSEAGYSPSLVREPIRDGVYFLCIVAGSHFLEGRWVWPLLLGYLCNLRT